LEPGDRPKFLSEPSEEDPTEIIGMHQPARFLHARAAFVVADELDSFRHMTEIANDIRNTCGFRSRY
jgi:hypothetical protein